MNAQQEITETKEAQEMIACYRRAESVLAGFGTSNLVQNDMLAPHWIDESDYFWYERATKMSDGDSITIGKEYRLVNAKAASNEPAFDHDALAKALASASGKEVAEVDKNSLPIKKRVRHF